LCTISLTAESVGHGILESSVKISLMHGEWRHMLGNKALTWNRPELADPISATIQQAQQTQFADSSETEYHFMVERDDFVEESFFLWSLVPLVGVGTIQGM
jgi:hypothetical protein